MQLVHDRPQGYFFIRRCSPAAVTVIDRELTTSFIIMPDRVVERWPVDDAGAIDAAAVAVLLELEPELVLLGSGTRQVFPPREALLPLLRAGIGVEVMDNAAACRTYNLLAGEGRRIAAALILAS